MFNLCCKSFFLLRRIRNNLEPNWSQHFRQNIFKAPSGVHNVLKSFSNFKSESIRNDFMPTESLHVVNELLNEFGFAWAVGANQKNIEARERRKLHQVPRPDLINDKVRLSLPQIKEIFFNRILRKSVSNTSMFFNF